MMSTGFDEMLEVLGLSAEEYCFEQDSQLILSEGAQALLELKSRLNSVWCLEGPLATLVANIAEGNCAITAWDADNLGDGVTGLVHLQFEVAEGREYDETL